MNEAWTTLVSRVSGNAKRETQLVGLLQKLLKLADDDWETLLSAGGAPTSRPETGGDLHCQCHQGVAEQPESTASREGPRPVGPGHVVPSDPLPPPPPPPPAEPKVVVKAEHVTEEPLPQLVASTQPGSKMRSLNWTKISAHKVVCLRTRLLYVEGNRNISVSGYLLYVLCAPKR